MHITILTVGSRGDVQPYIALGLGLQQAGYRVQLATTPRFKTWIESYGIEFAPVEGDMQAMLTEEAGQKLLESGGNPITSTRQFAKTMELMLEQSFADFWAACQRTDVIISAVTTTVGYDIAEALGVPFYLAALLPITANQDFPFPTTGPGIYLGGLYNQLTYSLMGQLLWQTFRKPINQFRQSTLGLPVLPVLSDPFKRMEQNRVPIFYGYSSHVLPKPRNWAEYHHVTGYWFLDSPEDFSPPSDLVDFLAADSPPVCIGFGSMTGRDPQLMTETVLAALAKTGQRAILLTGEGGIGQVDLPDTVFQLTSIPHDWLFPQVAAVVHHGGSGTTAAALRAGVPSIVIPFFSDQPFWGHRVAMLGVAPKPVPKQKLTVDRLATAIEVAIADSGMRQRAMSLGKKIQAENGVEQAVKVFHQHLGL